MPRPTQVASSKQPRCLYGPFTLSGPTFQTVPVPGCLFADTPTTPDAPRRARFRLFPFRSPLLRESMFLSLPAGTKMFQFPAFAALARCTHFMRAGFPIRTPPDQILFADPRRFSQLTASFIASESLGIPRSLLSSFSCESTSLSFLPIFLKLQSRNHRNRKTRFLFIQTHLISIFLTSFSLSVLSMIFNCPPSRPRTAVSCIKKAERQVQADRTLSLSLNPAP